MFVGKFESGAFLDMSVLLGPAIFIGVNSLMVIAMLNLFITILLSSFSENRIDFMYRARRNEDVVVLDFVKEKCAELFRTKKEKEKYQKIVGDYNAYVDYMYIFDNRADLLIKNLIIEISIKN